MPRSFDPARAAAAPETDVAAALFDGLTSLDPKTSDPIPELAEKWSTSEDKKVWTFQLRKDVRWSNGKRLTAGDIVSSWKRLALLGDKAAHRDLIKNIVGLKELEPLPGSTAPATPVLPDELGLVGALRYQPSPSPTATPAEKKDALDEHKPADKKTPLGIEAVNDVTLRVTLEYPDPEFAKLVANPIFHPVYGDGSAFEKSSLTADIVTSGAFTIASIGTADIALARSDTYWNKDNVELEHVRLIAKENAEAALDAYKNGDLDAVTNADFEPLALKLLTPYQDFRQATHGALGFYQVNTEIFPFNDRRIREALAVSIDRERIADVELGGSVEPATHLLPERGGSTELRYDVAHAEDLLDKAGFPSGEGFPKIRLVIGRNDTQQRIAKAVARMWKQNLNLDTQIIVKEPQDMEAVRASGEFDLIRRGEVLPASDELVSLATILGSEARSVPVLKPFNSPVGTVREDKRGPAVSETAPPEPATTMAVWTEDDALYELAAIPLYFPLSYSLVKPYVEGFEIDGNGSPDLRQVSIDSGWQPKRGK